MKAFGFFLVLLSVGGAVLFGTMPKDGSIDVWVVGGVSAFAFLLGIKIVSSSRHSVSAARLRQQRPLHPALTGVSSNQRVAFVRKGSNPFESPETAKQPPKASNESSQVFVSIGGADQGPYTMKQLRKMWDSGAITANALYWIEGMEEWKELAPIVETQEINVPPTAAIPVEQSRPKVTKVTFESRRRLFFGTMPLMVKLAMRSIQDLGWRIENANESIGLVTFKTGVSMGSWSGVSCSLNIEEVGENWFHVVGTGNQNLGGAQLLALNFGEAERKAQQVIQRMEQIAANIR